MHKIIILWLALLLPPALFAQSGQVLIIDPLGENADFVNTFGNIFPPDSLAYSDTFATDLNDYEAVFVFLRGKTLSELS